MEYTTYLLPEEAITTEPLDMMNALEEHQLRLMHFALGIPHFRLIKEERHASIEMLDQPMSIGIDTASGEDKTEDGTLTQVLEHDDFDIQAKAFTKYYNDVQINVKPMHGCTGIGCKVCLSIDQVKEKAMGSYVEIGAIQLPRYSKSQIGQALASQKRAVKFAKKLKRKERAAQNRCKGY